MKFLRTSIMIAMCLIAWNTHAADERAIFDQSFGDYSEEIVEAKEQSKKGVLLFFEMDECPFCHRMKTTVLNQPKVMAYLKKHFLIFSIDVEGDVEMTNFAGKETTMKDFAVKDNRVRATPVFAFYNLKGEKVTKYTGPTSGVEEMMWLAEYVVKEEYKRQRFTKFKKMKRKEKKEKNK